VDRDGQTRRGQTGSACGRLPEVTGPPRGRRAYAPGRVNLIGDHTDYNGGLALPMGIDLGVSVTYEPGPGETLVIRTDLAPEVAEISRSVETATAVVPRWARLAKAIVDRVEEVPGGEVVVRSNLPSGAGLSSSAAFGVALALALGVEPIPIAVARLCQAAEQAIGVPVGLMDPWVSMAATAGHALMIDFAALETAPVTLPDDAEFVIIDSGMPRSLDASPYASRNAECQAAATVVGCPLGLATGADLDRISDPLLWRRARHVVSEVARVRRFADALSSDDLSTAGAIMLESHRSLADDFEVSSDALDDLVRTLRAMPGVFGARLTGAGFGGCVVALTQPGVDVSLTNRWWHVRPSAGASVHAL